MAKRDHYETLGVARGASDAEVRSAYLLLAKMLHPDRFDPKQQAQEWRKAHEMLLDLNEAYSVLRDPESRRRYDASTSNTDGPRPSRATEEGASQRRSTATDQGARSSATPHEPPSDFGTLQRGARAVSRLPAKIQQRLTEIRSGVLTDATVFTSSCAWYYFGACIGALLLAALFGLANDFLWSEDTRSLYAVLSVAGTAGTWFCLRRTWDWHATAIKNFVAVRPLYVIRAHFGLVEWWPRNHVKEYQRKNHYVNGIPTRTSLQISLPGRVIRIPSAREAQLATLRQGLRTWASRMSALEAPGNLDWLRAADDFQGLSQTAYDPDAGKTFSFARLKRYAAELLLAAGIGVAYFLAIRQANDYFDDKLRWQEAININRASGYRKYQTDRPRGRHVEAARANLNLIYNRASEGYARANVGSDPEAKVAVLRVLKFLGEHNDWKVGTVFERANQIQPDVVQALRGKYGVRNVLEMGDSFSEGRLRQREGVILKVVNDAFAKVVPDDILRFTGDASTGKPRMLVSYRIRLGDGLYFRESDAGLAPVDRPYFPAILIDWEFELRDEENGGLYTFSLQSQPADHFRYSAKHSTAEAQLPAVYDAMADSAFDDLKAAIVRRLGINSGSVGSSMPPVQPPVHK